MKKILHYILGGILGLNLIGCSPPRTCQMEYTKDVLGKDRVQEILKWDEREILKKEGLFIKKIHRNYELLIDNKKTGIIAARWTIFPELDCYAPEIEVFDYNRDGLKDLKITTYNKGFKLEVYVQKEDETFEKILSK
ncbi:MAG: hypothetical protein ABIH28_01310 [archaeon]